MSVNNLRTTRPSEDEGKIYRLPRVTENAAIDEKVKLFFQKNYRWSVFCKNIAVSSKN
jgi:hypothetical protein